MSDKTEKLRRRECYEAILNRSFWKGHFEFEGNQYRYNKMRIYILRGLRWIMIKDVIGEERLVNFLVDYHDLYRR